MPDSEKSYQRDYYHRVTKPKRQARVLTKEQGSCYYCGEIKTLAIDHVIPRKRGGSDSNENIVFACYWCNMSKGAKLIEEWRFSIAKQLVSWPEFRPMQIEWLRSHGFDPEAVATALLSQVKFAFEGGNTLKRWSATAMHSRERAL